MSSTRLSMPAGVALVLMKIGSEGTASNSSSSFDSAGDTSVLLCTPSSNTTESAGRQDSTCTINTMASHSKLC